VTLTKDDIEKELTDLLKVTVDNPKWSQTRLLNLPIIERQFEASRQYGVRPAEANLNLAICLLQSTNQLVPLSALGNVRQWKVLIGTELNCLGAVRGYVAGIMLTRVPASLKSILRECSYQTSLPAREIEAAKQHILKDLVRRALTAMWLWTLSTAKNGNGNGKQSRLVPDDAEEMHEDEEEYQKSGKAKLSGYFLEYDAARKIAQGLGVHLEKLQTLVEVKGDKARLIPVDERTKALFGKTENDATIRKSKKKLPQKQFDFMKELEEVEKSSTLGEKHVTQLGNTTLDRLHQAMILFAAGRGEALKRFLVEEGVGRDERFWRLAQAFSALYPKNSDEKRWVDGVMARKKGLGF